MSANSHGPRKPCTVAELFANLAAELVAAMERLRPYCSIKATPPTVFEAEEVRFGWIDPPRLRGVSSSSTAWAPLDAEGDRAHAAAAAVYRNFEDLAAALLLDGRKTPGEALVESLTKIQPVIRQLNPPRCRTVEQAFSEAAAAANAIVGQVAGLGEGQRGEAVYVPDTNALIFNPAIEDWTFADAPRFTVIFVPAVVAELDGLKVTARTEAVRQKVEELIRRIKGYRARGRLVDGVPLRSGVSKLVANATENQAPRPLGWLDPSNADDRILATTIEVMRRFPQSPVAIVTRDLNLQNKCELAGVAFVEPPPVWENRE